MWCDMGTPENVERSILRRWNIVFSIAHADPVDDPLPCQNESSKLPALASICRTASLFSDATASSSQQPSSSAWPRADSAASITTQG